MKVKEVVLPALMMASLSLSVFAGGGKTHWGYSGHEGPEHWGELDPSYSICASGKNQSPINLTEFIEGDLEAISFDYHTGGNEILNNGHTVQVNYKGGSAITVNGASFELKQFHFHAPSENHIDGKSFPLEVHLVHADANGNLAVVAVMFEKGKANKTLKGPWSHMPKKAGEKNALEEEVSAEDLLPGKKGYYRFNGSLTTPPCSEGVLWMVMKQSVSVSEKQIEAFSQAVHHANNRPIQATHARMVVK